MTNMRSSLVRTGRPHRKHVQQNISSLQKQTLQLAEPHLINLLTSVRTLKGQPSKILSKIEKIMEKFPINGHVLPQESPWQRTQRPSRHQAPSSTTAAWKEWLWCLPYRYSRWESISSRHEQGGRERERTRWVIQNRKRVLKKQKTLWIISRSMKRLTGVVNTFSFNFLQFSPEFHCFLTLNPYLGGEKQEYYKNMGTAPWMMSAWKSQETRSEYYWVRQDGERTDPNSHFSSTRPVFVTRYFVPNMQTIQIHDFF